MQYALELKNVHYAYHTLEGETYALKDITFSVREGEFIALVGPSGCGKSTLLHLIAGLLTPEKGLIKINGSYHPDNTSGIGYMLQKDELLEWRTIYQNVLLGLEIQHALTARSRALAESPSYTIRPECLCKCKTIRTFRGNAPESRADPHAGPEAGYHAFG